MGRGDARGLAKTDVAPIILCNGSNNHCEYECRSTSASWKAASSVFSNEEDDEESSNMVEAAPV